MYAFLSIGQDGNACPFFAARSISKKAQIVFCPYQYLLDDSIRKSVGIDLRNAVVIIDEVNLKNLFLSLICLLMYVFFFYLFVTCSIPGAQY
jgi:hypothetical protein